MQALYLYEIDSSLDANVKFRMKCQSILSTVWFCQNENIIFKHAEMLLFMKKQFIIRFVGYLS